VRAAASAGARFIRMHVLSTVVTGHDAFHSVVPSLACAARSRSGPPVLPYSAMYSRRWRTSASTLPFFSWIAIIA
jgi:hypothetical protein